MKNKSALLILPALLFLFAVCQSSDDYYAVQDRVDVKDKPGAFARTTMILPFGAKVTAGTTGKQDKYRGKEGSWLHCKVCGGYVFDKQMAKEQPVKKGRLKLVAFIDPALPAAEKEAAKQIMLFRGNKVRLQFPAQAKELSGSYTATEIGMNVEFTGCTQKEANCTVKPGERKAKLLFNRSAGNFFFDLGGKVVVMLPFSK